MPPMSSCSRRQPRWDSRLSNNQHARPRRMPGGTFDHEVRSGLLKDASPFCYSSKIYSSSNKNNPNCKKRLACGTFRKLTQACGRLRNFPQVSRKCAGRLRNFPQAHSSVRDVCGTLRKHALFLKIVIDFVRKTSDSARRPRGEIRKTAFSVRNTYVRCG